MASGVIKKGGQSVGLSVEMISVDNLTVAASTYGTQNIEVERAGKTPLGVVGYTVANATNSGANSSWISVRSAFVYVESVNDWHYVQINYRNHGSSSAKVRVSAYILYMDN